MQKKAKQSKAKAYRRGWLAASASHRRLTFVAPASSSSPSVARRVHVLVCVLVLPRALAKKLNGERPRLPVRAASCLCAPRDEPEYIVAWTRVEGREASLRRTEGEPGVNPMEWFNRTT